MRKKETAWETIDRYRELIGLAGDALCRIRDELGVDPFPDRIEKLTEAYKEHA